MGQIDRNKYSTVSEIPALPSYGHPWPVQPAAHSGFPVSVNNMQVRQYSAVQPVHMNHSVYFTPLPACHSSYSRITNARSLLVRHAILIGFYRYSTVQYMA
jgi:hypothetical protein